MWARQEGLQAINEEYLQFRVNARRTAFNVDEFGETEQVKYDLDSAGITGEVNPRSYTVKRPVNSADGNMNNGFDVRDIVNR
jgi:hypothetical protein